MICAPARLYFGRKGERDCAAFPPPPLAARPAPPGTGRGPWFLSHCGEDPRSNLQGRSLCVCWGATGGGAVPQMRRCCPLREPLLSSRKAPGCAPSSGQGAGTVHRAPAPRRPGPGPRSALGPSARFFVARPQRSIAPSPSPAAGKGHPRTGGGGAARGTLARAARRPSHPGRPPALRGCFWLGYAHSWRPGFSVLCFPHFYLCLSGQTGVYLFFACSGSAPVPHSFSYSP